MVKSAWLGVLVLLVECVKPADYPLSGSFLHSHFFLLKQKIKSSSRGRGSWCRRWTKKNVRAKARTRSGKGVEEVLLSDIRLDRRQITMRRLMLLKNRERK